MTHNILNKEIQQLFFLRDTDKTEVLDIVNNFKNKTSRDCNDIDMLLIKQLIAVIVDPIVYISNLSLKLGSFPTNMISNLSLKLGSFPTNMKIAKVVPIFKAGEQNLYTNYRPISLLPQFSKILEKIFSIRLDSFIDKHGILTDSQYGFRTNRSTSLALIDLVE